MSENGGGIMNEKRICELCGNEITKGKGMNQKAYLYALQRGAHISCLRIHEGIMRKYRISSNDYLNAVVDGLFQLFPDMEETKGIKDYNSRMRKAKEEIEENFPYLKEKKKEEEKKDVGVKEKDQADVHVEEELERKEKEETGS